MASYSDVEVEEGTAQTLGNLYFEDHWSGAFDADPSEDVQKQFEAAVAVADVAKLEWLLGLVEESRGPAASGTSDDQEGSRRHDPAGEDNEEGEAPVVDVPVPVVIDVDRPVKGDWGSGEFLERGCTALAVAAAQGAADVMRVLLAAGADVDLATRDKEFPIDLARSSWQLQTWHLAAQALLLRGFRGRFWLSPKETEIKTKNVAKSLLFWLVKGEDRELFLDGCRISKILDKERAFSEEVLEKTGCPPAEEDWSAPLCFEEEDEIVLTEFVVPDFLVNFLPAESRLPEFVTRIAQVRNDALWARYVRRRESLARYATTFPNQDCVNTLALHLGPSGAGKEVWLWHVTSVRCAAKIVEEGFVIPEEPKGWRHEHENLGGWQYGRGVYLGDELDRCLMHARDTAAAISAGLAGSKEGGEKVEEKDSSCVAFLCRVALGKVLFTTSFSDFSCPERAAEQGCHSVVAETVADWWGGAAGGGLNRRSLFEVRTFVALDGAQVYPTFMLEMRIG